jgi:hypothetical protein
MLPLAWLPQHWGLGTVPSDLYDYFLDLVLVSLLRQSSMDAYWDLSVENRDGQTILAIEVKAICDTSPEWAAQWRRNILAHGIYQHPPYLLMVFPNVFYLWVQPAIKAESNVLAQDRLPDYIIDAHSILQPYFDRANSTAQTIRGQSLEIIVMSWLSVIIHTDQSEDLDDSLDWLMKSGLWQALRGTQFPQEVAA